MRVKPLLVAAVVVISSAALVCPTEGAQRQRYPGGESRSGGGGGGGQQGGGQQGGGQQGGGRQGGDRQGGNGGGGTAQRQGGGQDGGQRRAAPRSADNRNGNGNGGGRRQAAAQPESRPPQAVPNDRPRQQTEVRQQGNMRQAQPRRVPDATTDLRRGTSERFDQGRVGEQPRVAVPRPGVSDPRRYNNGNWTNGYRVTSPRYRAYNNRYYSGYPYYGHARPYYYYPYAYGYGPYGRGYFYFDLHYNSYVFYPPTVYRYDNSGSYYGTYGYPTGELRLQVRPPDAQVFIDGAYAGTVDQFDGTFQSLRLEGGEYKVEIVAPGFEPLDFDVHITPGEKVTYKGDLLPEQQGQGPPYPELPPQP